MSSFVRKGGTAPSSSFNPRTQQHVPGGCRTSVSGTVVASTGIASFDALLGDGLPLGHSVLLLEDAPRSSSNYASTMLKCFIAQGLLAGGHVVYIASDADAAKLLASLPAESSRPDGLVAPPAGPPAAAREKMTIAWRYKHIQQVESALDPRQRSPAAALDLGRRLDLAPHAARLHRPADLEQVARVLEGARAANGAARVALHSYGQPLAPPDGAWLRRLQQLVRQHGATLMTTCAARLHDPRTVRRAAVTHDAVFDVQSFAGTPKEAQAAFREYQGFLRVVRPLRLPDSFALALPETSHLAFKCKLRRFVIEKFHLPPELGEPEGASVDF